MRMLRSARGQSTAEYAVLFAIVIGAAVAMQQYVKTRLQASVKKYTDEYATAAALGNATKFDPTRLTKSASATDQIFTTARDGIVESTSGSETGIKKQ